MSTTTIEPTEAQRKIVNKAVVRIEGGESILISGSTGIGKSSMIGWIQEKLQRRAVVLAPNKLLTVQLYYELDGLFRDKNRVFFYVSYYDFFRPESYLKSKNRYLEKISSKNNRIDNMRKMAYHSYLENPNTIVCATVSSIYPIGETIDSRKFELALGEVNYQQISEILIRYGYTNNRGNTADHYSFFPLKESFTVKIRDYRGLHTLVFSDDHDKVLVKIIDYTGKSYNSLSLFSLKESVDDEHITLAVTSIREEMLERKRYFLKMGKKLEANRIEMKVMNDCKMLVENGYCSGIENYAYHFTANKDIANRPMNFLDLDRDNFLLVIDESHLTIPQLRAMYTADRRRKEALVENGFRLESCFYNRPMKYDEFYSMFLSKPVLYLSSTPGTLEVKKAYKLELIHRPTGVLDPKLTILPKKSQLRNTLDSVKENFYRGDASLIITTRKDLAEEIFYFANLQKIKIGYIHSELPLLDRLKAIKALRERKLMAIVGINLLREGVDIPEVSYISILDADMEGFLRSTTSLLQYIGRAARNPRSYVEMYADRITHSIKNVIETVERRRQRQMEYNLTNTIEVKSIVKSFDSLDKVIELISFNKKMKKKYSEHDICLSGSSVDVERLKEEMLAAANSGNYTRAIEYRKMIYGS